jgi:small multidrug resistance pump
MPERFSEAAPSYRVGIQLGRFTMTAYYYLAIAICAEVIATVSMKAVKGLSTPLPLILVIVGYATAFWMLTLVVRSIPVGVAYAVWAGMGIVMVSIAALFIYGQKLDLPAILGMALIVCGVVVIQLFSNTAGH